MPRTKGSKNRPKINTTNDYASQIAEKQETIASLNTEIASITANIDTLKIDLKEKKSAFANSHFLRPAGPHFPASQGHIKRPVLEIGRAERVPPC